MKLYGTYPSHFTRKVRVVLAELSQPHEFIVVSQLMETGSEYFAGNPLHLIPVLEHAGSKFFESDIICEYLIETFGKGKELNSFLPNPNDREQKYNDLKRIAVMNGGMSAGVKIIRAMRSGIPEFEKYVFFRQEREAIRESLQWLEKDLASRTAYYPNRLTMLDITLMCYLEWALFRGMIPDLFPYPGLNKFMHTHCLRPSFADTHPAKGG